jgi:hypothetical protein
MKFFWLFCLGTVIGWTITCAVVTCLLLISLWFMFIGALLMFFSFADSPSIMQIIFRFSLGLVFFSGAGICGFATIKTAFFGK